MSDILRWHEVKTRKSHKCWGCGKEYPAGSQMISAAYADEGTVSGGYWCETCQEYMRRYFESGDECGKGEIYANDPKTWDALKMELGESQ